MSNDNFRALLKDRLAEILLCDVEFTKSELCAVLSKVYVSVAKAEKVASFNEVVRVPIKRKPSEYNLFIRDRIAEMSVGEPSIVRFRRAAGMWKVR
jgi:hypothetical protein